MNEPPSTCVICRGPAGDPELERVQVWEDALWRLTVSLASEVPGFAYLEPKRHIPSIADLDGEEARAFGSVMGRVCSVLRDVTEAKRVYVYIFGGGIPHLHVHLAPHREGDALSDRIIRGETVVERLPSGAGRIISAEFPALPEAELLAVAERVRDRMVGGS